MKRICRLPNSATAAVRRRLSWSGIAAAGLCLAALLGREPGAGAQVLPTNYVETVNLGLTGTGPNNTTTFIPGIATWRTIVRIHGGHWPAGAAMDAYLFGPLNTLGVAPIRRGPLANLDDTNGAFKADANGDFQGSLRIPYQNTFNQGPLPIDPDITRPGLYRIRVIRRSLTLPTAGDISDSGVFSICPNTTVVSIPGEPLWHFNRGARDGFLGGYSPERTDPEYVTVWNEQPVALYATVAPSNLDGSTRNGLNQGSHIAFHDYPWTHFAHDFNLHLIPDFEYLWVMATASFQGEAEENDTGRIEWEWETQNNGSPFQGSYGQGNIGVPLFALPTVGDRIYTVGRWILDNGHPDEGDRSEIHPPRMIATMRKRHTVVPFGPDCVTRASQVDIFVSGHGGGINQSTYAELERLLGNNGKGGARLKDFGIGTPADPSGNALGEVYHRLGPKPVAHGDLAFLLALAGFVGIAPDIFPLAGPSAMGTDLSTGLPSLSGAAWGKRPESRAVNDMDYEFDVPLPPRPPDATTPVVQITTQSMHTTAVEEAITYINPDPGTGFPTAAHIRLPYRGADNGIYARTLRFYWDAYSTPGNHFVVQLNDIVTSKVLVADTFYVGPQPLYLWVDVCGQWAFLPDLNPDALLKPKPSVSEITDRVSFAGLPGAKFDVYLDPIDTMRVFVGGYAQRDMDSLFGRQFSRNAYDAGIEVALAGRQETGTGDNKNLGGAVFDELIPLADLDSGYVLAQSKEINTLSGGICPSPVMKMSFRASFVPSPPHVSSSGAAFGTVCGDETRAVGISNTGQSPLVITGLAITGTPGEFSLVPSPALPITVAPGGTTPVQVRFSRSTPGAAVATLDIFSNDPCNPTFRAPLTGTRSSPTIAATANTGRTPSLVVGSSTIWPVTISNIARGLCNLTVRPSLSGTGGRWTIVLPDSYLIKDSLGQVIGTKDIVVPPGGTNTDLAVKFTCTTVTTKAVGTLTLTSNDLVHPTTTLVFGAEGVPVGMRVVVVGHDGTPYPVVDSIKLKSSAGKVNTHLKDVPLTTIDPPQSWKRIQYHFMTALDPDAAGTSYDLLVQVGNKKQTHSFTLMPGEFKELTVTLP